MCPVEFSDGDVEVDEGTFSNIWVAGKENRATPLPILCSASIKATNPLGLELSWSKKFQTHWWKVKKWFLFGRNIGKIPPLAEEKILYC